MAGAGHENLGGGQGLDQDKAPAHIGFNIKWITELIHKSASVDPEEGVHGGTRASFVPVYEPLLKATRVRSMSQEGLPALLLRSRRRLLAYQTRRQDSPRDVAALVSNKTPISLPTVVKHATTSHSRSGARG